MFTTIDPKQMFHAFVTTFKEQYKQMHNIPLSLQEIHRIQNIQDISYKSPYVTAVRNRLIEVLDMFTRANPAAVNQIDDEGNSLLHHAAAVGSTAIIDRLINKELHPNTTNRSDNVTALHLAAMNGHVNAVKMLLQVDASVNAVAQGGLTPLHFAALHGNAQVIKVLLQDNRDDVNAANNNGFTPLHVAAKHGHAQAINALLEFGANIHVVDNNQDRPLALAPNDKQEEITDIFINSVFKRLAEDKELVNTWVQENAGEDNPEVCSILWTNLKALS